jgi:SAM-dependent methyltransferase
MDPKLLYYPESRFGGFTDIDGTLAFYLRVNALLDLNDVVLDVGCGRGAYVEDPVVLKRELRSLRGKCRRVIGIDVDQQARDNPGLDEFYPIESDRWPVDNRSIDLCLCDFVLEHIADPRAFFGEIERTIRPGGYVCIRTPNSQSYVGLLARMIPNRFHRAVVGRVQDGRKAEDVFPTLYRCNTRRRLRSMLGSYGFEHHVYGYEAEPSYLTFSPFIYGLGVAHQRWAPNALKPTLFAFGCKKATVDLPAQRETRLNDRGLTIAPPSP